MMQKMSVELSRKQATQLLNQLPVSMKIQLVRLWERETWPKRFRQLLAQVDRRNPRVARAALKDDPQDRHVDL